MKNSNRLHAYRVQVRLIRSLYLTYYIHSIIDLTEASYRPLPSKYYVTLRIACHANT